MNTFFIRFWNIANSIVSHAINGLLCTILAILVIMLILSAVNLVKLKMVFNKAHRSISIGKLLSCYFNLMIAYNVAYLGLILTHLGKANKEKRKVFHKLFFTFWFKFNVVGKFVYDYLFVTDLRNESYIVQFAKDISRAIFLKKPLPTKKIIIDGDFH